MQLAYVILAHRWPHQLARLIDSLDDGDVHTFVHIGTGSPQMYDESTALLAGRPRVHFVPRRTIRWGEYGMTDAAICGLREVRSSGIGADRVMLLSGQDYPIKSTQYIREFFEHAPSSNFVEHFSFDGANRWDDPRSVFGARRRVQDYHVWFRSRRVSIPLRRRLPDGLTGHGGSFWVNLTGEAVDYLLDYLDTHPRFERFMRHTFLPDEMTFQILLANSPLASTLVNDDLRYIDWTKGLPTPPAVMSADDFDALAASSALFARKFDLSSGTELVDRIDRELRGLAPSAGPV